MSKKTLAKDVDIAAGFFSQTNASDESYERTLSEKITAPSASPEKNSDAANSKINKGGRPKKEGLKNEQFTLTMNPETYEKLKIISEEYTRGNFSGLIDEAIKAFCRENSINLSDIKLEPEVLKKYEKKQKRIVK